MEDSGYCDKGGENYRGRTIMDQDYTHFENGEKPTQDAEGCDLPSDGFLAWVDEVTEPLCGLTLADFHTTRLSVWAIAYKAKERNGELVRGKQWTKTAVCPISISVVLWHSGAPLAVGILVTALVAANATAEQMGQPQAMTKDEMIERWAEEYIDLEELIKRLEKENLNWIIREEEGLTDFSILLNVDFGHRTPMTTLPVGAMAEIDCDAAKFHIVESGVID